jgi:hypothetical protein
MHLVISYDPQIMRLNFLCCVGWQEKQFNIFKLSIVFRWVRQLLASFFIIHFLSSYQTYSWNKIPIIHSHLFAWGLQFILLKFIFMKRLGLLANKPYRNFLITILITTNIISKFLLFLFLIFMLLCFKRML